MAINGKTQTTVEGLVTSTTTTEGNFRTGMGDVLTQIDANQVALAGANTFPAFDNNTWISNTTSPVTPSASGGGRWFIGTVTLRSSNPNNPCSSTISITGNGSWGTIDGGHFRTGRNQGKSGGGNMAYYAISGFIAAGGALSYVVGSNAIITIDIDSREL